MTPLRTVAALVLPLHAVGCGSVMRYDALTEAAAPGLAAPEGRLLARAAELTLELDDPESAGARIVEQVAAAGGYAESSTSREDGVVRLALRVPDGRLDEMLAAFSELGDVARRAITATDVTDAVVDADARLKNLLLSRDRLRALFDKADDASQAVEVERELSRVQGEIESLDARLKSLRARVALARLDVELHREPLLGPLGMVGAGVWWVIRKLFVIRD